MLGDFLRMERVLAGGWNPTVCHLIFVFFNQTWLNLHDCTIKLASLGTMGAVRHCRDNRPPVGATWKITTVGVHVNLFFLFYEIIDASSISTVLQWLNCFSENENTLNKKKGLSDYHVCQNDGSFCHNLCPVQFTVKLFAAAFKWWQRASSYSQHAERKKKKTKCLVWSIKHHLQICHIRKTNSNKNHYLFSGYIIISTLVRHDFNIIILKTIAGATASWSISYKPLALSVFPQPVSFLLSDGFTFNSHYPLANVHIATGWHSSTKQKSHLMYPFLLRALTKGAL